MFVGLLFKKLILFTDKVFSFINIIPSLKPFPCLVLKVLSPGAKYVLYIHFRLWSLFKCSQFESSDKISFSRRGVLFLKPTALSIKDVSLF